MVAKYFWITTIGRLSNDAGDGKENWKKAIGNFGRRKLVPEHIAKDLGVILDTNLTYDGHITKTVSSLCLASVK